MLADVAWLALGVIVNEKMFPVCSFSLERENKRGTFYGVALDVILWDKETPCYGTNRFTFSGQGYDG